LALRLGIVNVDKMLHELSCSQFDEWKRVYQLQPWGWDIENHINGQLCAVIANSSGRLKQARKASDYYLKT
jgi:hypothetical protein